MRRSTRTPIEVRFHNHYVTVPEAGCWIWTGATYRKGYGNIARGRGQSPMPAHRLSYELHKGPIPSGMLVCHKCDTPACVNPEHLFLGVEKQNTMDAKRKGRLSVKLNWVTVNEIRASADPIAALAKRFEISDTMVRYILNKKSWSLE